jgi:CheY-like chemotaxis protein
MRHAALTGHCYVLIVDDDRSIREALADLLTDEGYDVEVAGDGQRALEICRSTPAPDVILLDLAMPVMDGLEFARVKATEPSISQIPVCVMTASGPEAALPPDAAAVLRKPLDADELLAAIKRLC